MKQVISTSERLGISLVIKQDEYNRLKTQKSQRKRLGLNTNSISQEMSRLSSEITYIKNKIRKLKD